MTSLLYQRDRLYSSGSTLLLFNCGAILARVLWTVKRDRELEWASKMWTAVGEAFSRHEFCGKNASPLHRALARKRDCARIASVRF